MGGSSKKKTLLTNTWVPRVIYCLQEVTLPACLMIVIGIVSFWGLLNVQKRQYTIHDVLLLKPPFQRYDQTTESLYIQVTFITQVFLPLC